MNELESLKAENENLRKVNAIKSDLISISAHQLRTSLSALKWMLKMFADKDLGNLTGEQDEFIQKALESNERMIALVNKLLTLNHTDDAEIEFEFKKVNVLDLLEQTIFEFYGETNKKGIELIFLKPYTEIPDVSCDREMTRVVFQNLIENAIKYSREGDKIFVSIKANEQENKVEISVRDTGIGIKDGDKEKIFNKFFRADNAIAKDHIGSGLGLFTTKNIIEHQKGKIWFESTEGQGTTFFVSLPSA
jgi:signal transduction histidine kinase